METIQLESIETYCPICGKPVIKVRETDHVYAHAVECENEFYRHDGDKLVKYTNPKGAWENMDEYKNSLK
jgi:hypothetical protein